MEKRKVRSDLGSSPNSAIYSSASQPICCCISQTKASQESGKDSKSPSPQVPPPCSSHHWVVPGWDPQTLRSALLLQGVGIDNGLPVEPDLLVETVRKSNLQRGWLVEEYVEPRVQILTPSLVSKVPVGMLPFLDRGMGLRVALLEGCWGFHEHHAHEGLSHCLAPVSAPNRQQKPNKRRETCIHALSKYLLRSR